jgi:hypothetical protein
MSDPAVADGPAVPHEEGELTCDHVRGTGRPRCCSFCHESEIRTFLYQDQPARLCCTVLLALLEIDPHAIVPIPFGTGLQ